MKNGAFVEPGIPIMPVDDKENKDKHPAARLASYEEFKAFAKVRKSTEENRGEGESFRDEMLESILNNLAREEEILMDEIIGLVDRSGIAPEIKEELMISLADVLTINSVKDLNVTKVVEIIQDSALDDAKKGDLTNKLRALVDSFSMIHN